jgi:prepilin-type N-terminal cleavage/methylation domain-containing protein
MGFFVSFFASNRSKGHRVVNIFKPREIRARHRAFTLVEIMVAVVIVSIGMIATLTSLSYANLHNDMEQERARAHQIVCEKMEQQIQRLYSNGAVMTSSTPTVWDNGTPDNTTDDTLGTLDVVATKPDGTLIASGSLPPVPAVRVTLEVTLSWHPRGRLHAKTMRETAMTYMVP